MREWVEVQWGVVHGTPPDAYVESAGTKPGGDVGRFTEDEARYIAGSTGKQVVRREVHYRVIEDVWQDA